MNNDTQLDSFETALLAELRREVAEHPSPATTPVPVRRPRRRRLAAGATVVAASVVAVFGLGSFGGSPAFAVDENSAGDVIVTVHRLDDADGLVKALKAKGIDADVSYDADGFGTTMGVGPDGKPLSDDELPPPPAGADGQALPGGGTQGNTESQDGQAGADSSLDGAGAHDACALGADPATLTQQGSDWVLTIPASSPLQDRHVEIGADVNGALSVTYAGDQPGSMCGMVSVTRAQ